MAPLLLLCFVVPLCLPTPAVGCLRALPLFAGLVLRVRLCLVGRCPWSGKPVSPRGLFLFLGVCGFCCCGAVGVVFPTPKGDQAKLPNSLESEFGSTEVRERRSGIFVELMRESKSLQEAED